jgi:hypothetical protein
MESGLGFGFVEVGAVLVEVVVAAVVFVAVEVVEAVEVREEEDAVGAAGTGSDVPLGCDALVCGFTVAVLVLVLVLVFVVVVVVLDPGPLFCFVVAARRG